MSIELAAVPSEIWFCEEGPEYDVVFSSRARLSRNLSGFAFPGKLADQESLKVQEKFKSAFGELDKDFPVQMDQLKNLSRTQKQMVLERNMISQDYSLDPENFLITDNTNRFSAVINEIDHFRFADIEPGLALEATLEKVRNLDMLLEKRMPWAVNLEWGYMNTEWLNAGTGLRMSVMFHLPAMVQTAMLDKTFKTVSSLGLGIRGFETDEGHSLGDVYQVSNQLSFGQTEDEIGLLLKDVSQKIIHLERAARTELFEKDPATIADRVGRAFGILRYCKILSVKEAIASLSDLRLGICLGLVKGVHLKSVTSLFFLAQRAHIQNSLSLKQKEINKDSVDQERAALIQNMLKNASIEEVYHV